MTSTAAEATRVYVRFLGYGTLQEIHPDHSATVRLDDGTEDHIPFGGWAYAASSPEYADKSVVDVSYLIRNRLKRDLGDDFDVTNSGVVDGNASWFRARYGPSFTIEVKVTDER